MGSLLLISVIKFVAYVSIVLVTVIMLVYAERRVSAFIQNRLGPNRVGPWGLFQALVDVVKLLLKEDIVPKNAYKPVHDLAPIISIAVALSTFAVIPFGNTIELFGTQVKLMIADVNVGILYLLSITSLGVYGVTLAGWSSNNKYSLLGGLRSSAQLISYELSMGLSIIGVLMVCGTLRLDQIVLHQTTYLWGWLPAWNIFLQPVAFFTFFIAAFAETNRLPFDLPEAEPELVGGYHTEYTGLKFGLFFLA
jgi:NADH-quinone oxidoreductase subunit H